MMNLGVPNHATDKWGFAARRRIAVIASAFSLIILQNGVWAAQATNLAAEHRDGQTFLTWTEISGTSVTYNVYRATTPFSSSSDLTMNKLIGTTDQNSSYNERASSVEGASRYFVIQNGQAALSSAQGLFVYTTVEDGAFYYAVTAVDGAEVTSIGSNAAGPVSETVAFPLPVLQRAVAGSSTQNYYVHWVTDVDSPMIQAMSNAPNGYFNFKTFEPDGNFPDPQPLILSLHGRGGSYNATPSYSSPDGLITLSPDSFIPRHPINDPYDDNDFWYGWNTDVPNSVLTGGTNMNFSARRIAYYIDWAVGNKHVDSNRVFSRGHSMGGIGTCFGNIVLRDKIAAGLATSPRFDFHNSGDTSGVEISGFQKLWGTEAQNVLTNEGIGGYDRLNANYLAQNHLDWDFGPVFTFSGRQDTVVGWYEKHIFYETMEDTRHGWLLFWDNRLHPGTGADATWIARQTELTNWMVANLRLDQSYPAFSDCSINNNPGNGGRTDGDIVGTINGYLTWNPSSIVDSTTEWDCTFSIRSDASASACAVSVTPRRLQAFAPAIGEQIDWSAGDIVTHASMGSGSATVAASGRVTIPGVSLNKNGVRLTLIRTADMTPPGEVSNFEAMPGN